MRNNKDDKQFDELLSGAFRKQYENEIANGPSDQDLEAMYPFTDEHLKKAQELSRNNKKQRFLWKSSLGKAATILLCVVSVSAVITLADPTIRGNVSNVVSDWIDQYVSIDFADASADDKIDISKANIGYIPDGYSLKEDNSDKSTISLIYSNEENEYIIIDIIDSKDIKLLTENETHKLTIYNINGYEGYMSYSEEMKQGSIYFGNSNFTVAVSGMTDKDELIKVAKNIDFKD